MKPWHKILLLALLLALVASLPAPARAFGTDDPSPSQPNWLQRLLQWLGWLPAETPPAATATLPPSFTPTPAVTEVRITSLEQLAGLTAMLTPGKRVRLYSSADDLDALTTAYLNSPSARADGLQSGKVTLLEGALKIEGALSRSVIEELGLPLFFSGDTLQVQGEGSLTAADCRLTVSLQAASVNGIPLPVVSLLDGLVNQALNEEWPPEVCVESVTITPQQVDVEGYRR